jgi:hypothetical protein
LDKLREESNSPVAKMSYSGSRLSSMGYMMRVLLSAGISKGRDY